MKVNLIDEVNKAALNRPLETQGEIFEKWVLKYSTNAVSCINLVDGVLQG